MGEKIKKLAFINAIAVSLFLFQLSFACTLAFILTWGKSYEDIYLSFSASCFYRKHPNNDNKICSLPSSGCFQQHFHDRFSVLMYNSDLVKLE